MDSNYEPFPNKTIRDWVLGIGEFSEENLRKSREETAKRMVATVMESMERHLDKVFSLDTNHDAAPAAKATKGNATAAPEAAGTGDTDKPVAWAVIDGPLLRCGRTFGFRWEAEAICRYLDESGPGHPKVVPLYLQRQPVLTDAERALLTRVWAKPSDVEALAALLERLK